MIKLLLTLTMVFLPIVSQAQGTSAAIGLLQGLFSGSSSGSTDRPNEYNPKDFFQETTPLQLRVMQTRVFNKPLTDVIKAIKSYCADMNGTLIPGKVGCIVKKHSLKTPFIFKGEKYETRQSWYNNLFIDYEFPDAEPGQVSSINMGIPVTGSMKPKTIVRIRLKFGSAKGYSDQLSNPVFYDEQFKALADTLFIDAIVLNPAEMQ